MKINTQIQKITDRIVRRSKETRSLYTQQMSSQFNKEFSRAHLSCGNLVHAAAGEILKNLLYQKI